MNVNDPTQVLAAVAQQCQATSVKLQGTMRRAKELQDCSDPTTREKELDGLVLGMLVGVLDNQILILAALTHLMAESAERHRARVEIVRPGIHGINGGRLL